MSFSLDLLEQADHLSRREKNKPRQASLRRATSIAYYSLFHLICWDCALHLAPHADEQSRSRMLRLFDHRSMKDGCNKFLQPKLDPQLASLLGEPVTADLRLVANLFVQLQEARHSADYDLELKWTRAKATQHVQNARTAVQSWNDARNTQGRDIFALYLFMPKDWDKRRRE